MNAIQGLHHITAMASNPQKNLAFYEKVLGQRLVKTTVNFDDPGTYHLYYGDENGSPGTIMTFFPWPHMSKGTTGVGETGAVGYNIPSGSYDYWMQRLQESDLSPVAGDIRFGQKTIRLKDPDGINLELIESASISSINHWSDGPVAKEVAIQGFHGVTLWLADVKPTAQLLTEQLGYVEDGQEGSRHRFKAASDGAGLYIDLLETPELPLGKFGAGSIHHIAFRTVDDEEQGQYLEALRKAGEQVTSVKDRQYFHSIYFRSPGGVLFEVATDAPGFEYDEPLASLGQSLKLPAWLEAQRSQIEAALPALKR
ncbi:MAG: ring-cleaving dioxygenase [Rhodothermales bacterium]